MESAAKKPKLEKSPCEKKTQFLDLNDDCIFGIFEKLSPCDLCSISFTCRRMKELALKSFQLKFPKQHIYIEGKSTTINKKKRQEVKFIEDQEKYLKYFSKAIREFRIKTRDTDIGHTFKFVKENCNENMKVLELDIDAELNENDGEVIAKQLKSVHNLTIESNRSSDIYGGLLKYCENLKELTNKCPHANENWITQSYPNLESLIIYSDQFKTEEKHNKIAYDFLQQNPQLKKLKYYVILDKIIELLLDYGEIQRFSLLCCDVATTQDQIYETLNTFTRNIFQVEQQPIPWFEIGFSINQSNRIERLETLFAIDLFQHINSLHLRICFNPDDQYRNVSLCDFFNKLASQQKYLEEITLTFIQMFMPSFKEIVQPFVRNSPKLKQIVLNSHIHRKLYLLYRPNDLIELNADRMKIQKASRTHIKILAKNEVNVIVPKNSLIDLEFCDFLPEAFHSY